MNVDQYFRVMVEPPTTRNYAETEKKVTALPSDKKITVTKSVKSPKTYYI